MKHAFLAFLLTLAGPGWLRAGSALEFVDALYRDPSGGHHYPTDKAAQLCAPELAALLQKAIQIRKAAERKSPDEKPPFADYPLLSPSPDAYSTHRIYASPSSPADAPLFIVELHYPPRDAVKPDYVFIDLLKAGNSWKIKDVRFLAGNPGPDSLSARLRSDIKEEAADPKLR